MGIEIEKEGEVAHLVLNRPDSLNSLNPEMAEELDGAVSGLEMDDDVRVVVVRGEGKGFCAGGDVQFLSGAGQDEAEEFSETVGNAMDKMMKGRNIYIAAVHGFAVGGGLELMCSCDLVVAEKGSEVGQPEAKLGLIPGFGGHRRLMESVGVKKAKELLLTGERITAEEAEDIGLVNRLVSDGAVEEAERLAEEVMEGGPRALAASKRVMYKLTGASRQVERAEFRKLFGREEQREGTEAFLEKRDPEWSP